MNIDRLEFTHNFYFGKSKANLKKVVLRIFEIRPDVDGGYSYRLAMDGLYEQVGSHRVESLFYLARDVIRAAHGVVCELVESNPGDKIYFEFDGEIVHLKDFRQIFLIPMEWPV